MILEGRILANPNYRPAPVDENLALRNRAGSYSQRTTFLMSLHNLFP
uniref:Uncharacterized protein n=1 Tax=Anguilla anguilla TaxID=7936 RepID=A0A0E9TA50_ANGAN